MYGLATSESGSMLDYQGSWTHIRNELSAELYTYDPKYGKLHPGHGYFERLKQIDEFPESFREYASYIRQIPRLAQQLIDSGFNPKILSYVVAMAPPDMLIETLESVNDHLSANP